VKPTLHEISFDGRVLARGFWLYVWEITKPNGGRIYYVGRTGDKSSGVCQSPFDRFSKHLGSNSNNNALQSHLKKQELQPEHCSFSFHALGPILADSKLNHGQKCDMADALEKALADFMSDAGYKLLNTVNSQMPLNKKLWKQLQKQFAEKFPKSL
jgi:hypothetical protein